MLAIAFSASPVSAAPPPHVFLVFFDEFSANLSPHALSIVAKAAAQAKHAHAKAIRIEARANANGSPDATMKIAETRAAVVRDRLLADGIPLTMIYTVPLGQAGTTDTGVAPRRVDIILEN